MINLLLSERTDSLQYWLRQQLNETIVNFTPLAGDASFRRYFRVFLADRSLIAVDAPPDREDSHAFIQIAEKFTQAGLAAPKVLAYDLQQGFMLLADMGDQLFLPLLEQQTVDNLYQKALTELIKIQRCSLAQVPLYSAELLQREMQVGKEWFLQKHLALKLTSHEEHMLQEVFKLLIDSALQQPQVTVHRDFHSRNLMLLKDGTVGILDFQDAVIGPITYDLVSLLKDCYIAWPPFQVTAWALEFQQQLLNQNLLSETSPQQFIQWFDWMGVQRHFKCLGIFARKFHRDNTAAYLGDLPRVLEYIAQVAQRYPQFVAFHEFLTQRVFNCLSVTGVAA